MILSSLLTKRITFDLDILQIDKKKISSSYCPIVTVIRIGCLRFFFSFVHCWFFEESNSVEITLNTFLRLLYKYMVQKLLDLTRALFITTKIHTPRWRLQKFKGNFYFFNHIKRVAPWTDNLHFHFSENGENEMTFWILLTFTIVLKSISYIAMCNGGWWKIFSKLRPYFKHSTYSSKSISVKKVTDFILHMPNLSTYTLR